MKKLADYKRDQSGSSAVEFALVVVPVVMFIFGTINLCLAMFSATQLNFATEATARCRVVSATSGYSGALCSDDTKAQAYFAARYHGPTTAPVVQFTTDANCGLRVTATTSYTVSAVLITRNVPLGAWACFPQ
jgi:Flp pilus assembly protein TadG